MADSAWNEDTQGIVNGQNRRRAGAEAVCPAQRKMAAMKILHPTLSLFADLGLKAEVDVFARQHDV